MTKLRIAMGTDTTFAMIARLATLAFVPMLALVGWLVAAQAGMIVDRIGGIDDGLGTLVTTVSEQAVATARLETLVIERTTAIDRRLEALEEGE